MHSYCLSRPDICFNHTQDVESSCRLRLTGFNRDGTIELCPPSTTTVNTNINLPISPGDILPKLPVFHLQMQVFSFRRINLIPFRGAARKTTMRINKPVWNVLLWDIYDVQHTHLSLQAPVHSTWPQGFRTRIRRSIWPRKSTYITQRDTQLQAIYIIHNGNPLRDETLTDLLQSSDWVGVALHKLLECNGLHVEGTGDLEQH